MKEEKAQKLAEKTQGDYDKIAEHFNQTRVDPWLQHSQFGKYFKKDMRVLDFGCGNGRMWKLVKEEAGEYVGLDFSSQLIALAKKNVRDKRVKFIAGNILNPPTDLGKFDLIWCIAVIHQVPSKEFKIWALKNLKSLLTQGGYGIITAWDVKSDKKKCLIYYKYLLKKLLFLEKNLGWGDVLVPWKNSQGEAVTHRYYHVFSRREFVKLIKKAGLEIVEEGRLLDKQLRQRNFYAVVK